MSSDAERDTVELPAPTPWPLVAAFGITLGFAGVVTNVVVTLVGVVCALAGAVGWWREVLPHEHVERVRVVRRPPRAIPTAPAPALGERGHRLRLPVEIHPYSSGLWGGLAGGAAMTGVAVLAGALNAGSVWYPINLLAAIALPSLATADAATLRAFHPVALAVGTVIHFVLSVFVGLLYAVILPMLPRRTALAAVWGGLVGPAVWTSLLWSSLGLLNPVLAARIDWTWFGISQIAFGLVTGLVVARSERMETLQTLSLAERAGVERSGDGEGRR
jgi:hypothetical protein